MVDCAYLFINKFKSANVATMLQPTKIKKSQIYSNSLIFFVIPERLFATHWQALFPLTSSPR